MSVGVDLCYATDGLRGGGDVAAATAEAADAIAGGLGRIMIDAAVFGQVDQAGPLVAVLTAVRDDAAELGRQVQARHADLAQRAAGVAAGGVRKIHVKE